MPLLPRPSSAYLSALLALLPRGRVWPRDPDSTLVNALSGLAPVYERSDAQACNLLVDSFPTTAVQLLPEWEATLGLPDPCLGPAPTIAARQAVVRAKLTARGGSSAAYFEQLALNLGFQVTVQNYAPARCGIARCGDPCYGVDWANAWSVTGPLGAVVDTDCETGRVGDRIRKWGNPVLECQLSEFAPAHAQLFFLYTPTGFFLDRTPLS